MTTNWDRLVDADPLGERDYVPRDLDAMLGRVMSTTPRPRRFWWVLRARVAGAVALSGALTAGAIALLASAPATLAPLVFAAPVSGEVTFANSSADQYATATSLTATATGDVVPTRFVDGGLSDAVASWPTYRLRAPSDPRVAITRVAGVLGLGAPRITLDGARAHAETASRSLSLTASPLDEWRLVTTRTRPFGEQRWSDHLSPRARARALAIGLGVTRAAAAAARVVSAPAAANLTVNVPITLASHASGLVDSFVFSASGTLESASGYLVRVGPARAYPLVSPRDAIRQIGAEAPLLAGALGPRVIYGPARGAANANAPAPGTRSSATVTLRHASRLYVLLATRDGAVAAVPAYAYGALDARPTAVVLALAPASFRLAGSR